MLLGNDNHESAGQEILTFDDNLNEEEHVDPLHLQIRAEPALREEVEVGETSVEIS